MVRQAKQTSNLGLISVPQAIAPCCGLHILNKVVVGYRDIKGMIQIQQSREVIKDYNTGGYKRHQQYKFNSHEARKEIYGYN